MNRLTEGEDYYYNAEGFVVFTEKYHFSRGFCCGNGCRHCPYDYENVPEPQRTKLRSAINNDNNPAPAE